MRKTFFSGILAFLIVSLAVQNTGCYLADTRPNLDTSKPKDILSGFVLKIERGKSIEVTSRDGKHVQGQFFGMVVVPMED